MPRDKKNPKKLPKPTDIIAVRQRIAKYCAYQERAHSDVKNKLYSYGLKTSDIEDILAWLITENYVNEERFAIAFAGGKFRIKKWGKIKIAKYLKQKGVSEYSVNKAIANIDNNEYQKTLKQIIELKTPQVKAGSIYELRHKISRYLISKGFEPDLVWEQINQLVN